MLPLISKFVMSMAFTWFCSLPGPCDGSMRVTSVILERPAVDYVNSSFARAYNFTAQRISRSDHFHYLHILFETYVKLDCETLIADITIDEFLSNTYRPTFVKFRLTSCELMRIGNFSLSYAPNITAPFKEYVIDKSKDKIILPIGVYYFQNVIISSSAVPDNFPFQNGRVNLKFLWKKALAAAVHLIIQLKMLPKRRYSKPPQ